MTRVFDNRIKYKGIGNCNCLAHLRIFSDQGNSKQVYIISELPENHGTSVTNWAKRLVNEYAYWVLAVLPINENPLDHFVWIEHYVRDKESDTYDIVDFEVQDSKLVNPRWRPTTKEAVEALVREKIADIPFAFSS